MVTLTPRGFILNVAILLLLANVYVSNGDSIHMEAGDLDRMAEFADVRMRMSSLFDSFDDVITAQTLRVDVDEDFNGKVVELIAGGEDLGDRISDVIKGRKKTDETVDDNGDDGGASDEKDILDKLQVSAAFITKRASSLIDDVTGSTSEEEMVVLREGLETLSERAKDVLWALKSVETKRRVKAWKEQMRGKKRNKDGNNSKYSTQKNIESEIEDLIEKEEIDSEFDADFDSNTQQDRHARHGSSSNLRKKRLTGSPVSSQNGRTSYDNYDHNQGQNDTQSQDHAANFDGTFRDVQYQNVADLYGNKQQRWTWPAHGRHGGPTSPSQQTTPRGSNHYFDLRSLDNYLKTCSDCAGLSQNPQCPLTNEINDMQRWSQKLQGLMTYGCAKPQNCRASGKCCVKTKPQIRQTINKMADMMRDVRNLMGRECQEECTKASCQREPQYSGWSMWTPCDVTCGQGSRLRRRQCSGATPGGRSCRGDPVEYQPCQMPSCCNDLIDGHWMPWTQWSRCVCVTGRRTRERQCTVPPSCRRYCKGPNRARQPCSRSGPDCDPCMDGNWSAWAPWTACSVRCGQGTKQRNRKCDNPPSNECGKTCPGSSVERDWCYGSYC